MAIARRELGSPTAPALVLIHGLGASGRAFDLVAPLLDEDGVEAFAAAGHSMGGLVAVALAELAPYRVTRIVLVNAPPTCESRTAARSVSERILRVPVLGPLANATVVRIPEAGHTAVWEAPERNAELIGMGAGAG